MWEFIIKMEEATGSWRKLHNEELHNLFFSPNIIRIIRLRTGQIYCCGGPGAIKMWRPLSITTNLGYGTF
jgi:hypothetical protein